MPTANAQHTKHTKHMRIQKMKTQNKFVKMQFNSLGSPLRCNHKIPSQDRIPNRYAQTPYQAKNSSKLYWARANHITTNLMTQVVQNLSTNRRGTRGWRRMSLLPVSKTHSFRICWHIHCRKGTDRMTALKESGWKEVRTNLEHIFAPSLRKDLQRGHSIFFLFENPGRCWWRFLIFCSMSRPQGKTVL